MAGNKSVQLQHMFMNGLFLEGKIISMCLEEQIICDNTCFGTVNGFEFVISKYKTYL